MSAFALTRQKLDLPPAHRIAIAAVAGGLFALSMYGVLRCVLGYAPPTPWVRDLALATHIVTVLIALPLGAYLFLTKKGGTRHRGLGKAWLALMGVTAFSTLFVRNLNDGNFSWIHLFTVLTFVAVPQAILSARRGDIAAHRKHMRNFFLGSLVIAGAFTFIPGRTMWQWAFADRAAVLPAQ